MSSSASRSRSTADARRSVVLDRAVTVFARSGYHATPVADVAAAAAISPAYVFRLFKGKKELFVAAVEHCFARVAAALEAGADRVPADADPAAVLDAMGGAYAELIGDRDLLMLQVHALSACDVPEIRAAVQAGYRTAATLARERSGADEAQVQRFIAWGQLCHLTVTAGLTDLDEPWARGLVAGIRHP